MGIGMRGVPLRYPYHLYPKKNNWDERDVQLDFSFLPEGVSYTAVLFKDGVNANKQADGDLQSQLVFLLLEHPHEVAKF